MQEKLKSDNIAKAIRQLPNPKTYNAESVTVMVGKLKYIFRKHKECWNFTND